MKFDYLIIDAGSAGCVLANRLTESSKNNVAIFEAGKPSDIWKVNLPHTIYILCMIQNMMQIILNQSLIYIIEGVLSRGK